MFSISSVERARVKFELKKIRAVYYKEVLDVFHGFVTVAYNIVVDETPQWTGHATAQWNIGINHLDVSRSHLYLKENLAVSRSVKGDSSKEFVSSKKKGDPEAVAEAKRRQTGIVEQIKLADMIFISNNVEGLLTGSYAAKLEANPNSYLRSVNDPGHMVFRTIEWFNARMNLLDPAIRAKIKKVKLSDSGLMAKF